MARRHVVVSGHYYASLAGLQILEAGGNAIDAGVATGLAIDVLESEFVGFGGVAPVMIHLAERRETHVISGVGVWPKAADLEYFHRHFGGRIPDGLLHTVVPAAPSIWIAALARFGTMSFGDVAAAAIRFARDGFPTYPFLAEQLAARQKDFAAGRPRPRSSCPDGRPPEVGEIFVQSDLGAHAAVHGGSGARARGRRSPRRTAGGARRVLPRRHRHARSCATRGRMAAGWPRTIWPTFRSPVEPPCRIRFGEFDVYGCGPGRRGRWCWRH